MARAFAVDPHRQNSNVDNRRPYPPAARPVVRKTGGIRVLEKSSGTRQISDSKSSQSDTQALLHRRVFYPNANDVPPRILATPGTETLDIQLLNLLALICRGFISPWYSKISRDRAFLLEIVGVASHVFRRIEAKLVSPTDSEEPIDALKLLCVSIPGVLERHIRDYRRAKEMEGSAYAAGVAIPTATDGFPITSFQALFHSLQPHAAVSSSSAFSHVGNTVPEKLPPYINADYVRALVDNILREVLPAEDYTAETERAVVTEVIVGIVLAGVLNKVSQPWFFHGLIIKFLERKDHGHLDQEAEKGERTIMPLATRISSFFANLPVLFYRMTAVFAYLSFIVVTALATPFSGKTEVRHLCRQPISLVFAVLDTAPEGRQVLSQVRWTASISTTIFGSVLDKILIHFFYTQIFTASSVLSFLKIVESALFPNGYPAPSVPDPTEEEQVLMKERAYRAIQNAIPKSVLPYLVPGLPPDEAAAAFAKDILEPFQDHFCNNHLYLFILDLVVANICPDLVVEQR